MTIRKEPTGGRRTHARLIFRKNLDVARFEVIVLRRYYRQDHLEWFRVAVLFGTRN